MRTIIGGVTLGWLLFGFGTAPACADGGSLLFAGTKGGYRITVFASPTPFRAGTVDISALVQDAATGNPLTPLRVIVRMTKSRRAALNYPATSEAATNKLLRAAQFELPEPGRWKLQVVVDGSHGKVVVEGEIEAAEPLPPWAEIFPWIAWPALAIVFFSIHQVLIRRSAGCGIASAVRSSSSATSHPR